MANDASAPISSRSTKELTSDSEIRFRSESGNGISAGNAGTNDPHLMFSPQKTYKQDEHNSRTPQNVLHLLSTLDVNYYSTFTHMYLKPNDILPFCMYSKSDKNSRT